MEDRGWEKCGYPRPFRRYQALALDAVDRLVERGESRAYVVMPPGAGKTVLGLEVARRLGRRTLVLTPNTAVQGQWLQQWEQFGGPQSKSQSHPQPASGGRLLKAGLTVLTYQALSVWDRTPDDEDEADDTSPGIAERRRVAVRDPDGHDLLALMHPRGRELVDTASRLGPWTLVLDECHHLLETWGALVRALARALGDDTWVLGLTATPAVELTARQGALHDELFSDCGFWVPMPAVVKEGELAPFQELIYLTAPSPEEDTWIMADRTRFADLQLDLVSERSGSLPFLDWLWRRLHDRRGAEAGAQLSWRELEQADPEVASAGLRLVHAGLLALPSGARLQEQHRVMAGAADWAVLLGAYANEHLAGSLAAADVALLRAVREVLPSLGFVLTGKGLRATTSPVDRVCALSETKAGAAVHVLSVEHDALGEDLRAVVLCDFEQLPAQAPSRLRGGPAVQASGSARLAFVALARSSLADQLRPVLCTGRTVALRREDLAGFRAACPPQLADRLLAEPFDGIRSIVRIEAGAGWSARVWTPLVTAWLVAGHTRCVVGTRGLLGEGWDCPPLNVVVDLSSAATATSVTQLRGRSLRLDPARPDKVADNWTVACVADDHPRGDADYLRAVRKHSSHLAPGRDGLVESGIGHCDPALGPYAAPDPATRTAVNGRSLARAAERDAARAAWDVGGAYAGLELATLRLKVDAPLGLPGRIVPASLLVGRSTLGAPAPAPLPPAGQPRRLWPMPVGGAVAATAATTVAQGPALGTLAGAGVGLLLGSAVAGRRYRAQLSALQHLPVDGQTASLRQLADAVADALHGAGGASVGAAGVRLAAGSGGWLALELEAPTVESRLFATCLDELLAPLGEPRWLVSRLVLPTPAAESDRRRLARARALGRPVDAAVAWHAVPVWLGRNKARVAAFETAWRAHVGAGRLVLARDPEGAALLELLRGEDPFSVTSRLRTTWR